MLAELTETLANAERQGQLAEKIRFFARAAILIVNEIGSLPITQGGANLFFQIVNARYEKGAMVLTSNRSFPEWGDPVVATALLDRLLHHAAIVRIEGASLPAQKTRRPHSRTRPRECANHAAAAPEKTRPAQKADPNRRLIWLVPKNTEKWEILLRH